MKDSFDLEFIFSEKRGFYYFNVIKNSLTYLNCIELEISGLLQGFPRIEELRNRLPQTNKLNLDEDLITTITNSFNSVKRF